jgi:hypothetical protein
MNLMEPKNVKQVRSILGLVGWYRRFIPNFAELTAPLTELTKKSKGFKFTEEARKAFNEIKLKLTSAPVLVTPDYEKPFIIACDASKIGVGGVLSQLDESSNERPIAYFSRKLNKCQKNYSVTELECLAAILSIEKFREYVEGLEFTVITDHASLKWLMNQSDLHGRLARWALKLQGFNFKIEHRKGNLNIVPDALSRLFEDENLDSIEIQNSLVNLNSPLFTSDSYEQLKSHIRAKQDQLPDLKIDGNYIYKRTEFDTGYVSEESRWKLWIPEELTPEVIKAAHDPPIFAHGGIGRTLHVLKRNLYWPGMVKQVRKYILGCEVCKGTKAPNTTLRPPMGEQSVTERPFQKLYIDFLGPYPRSKSGNIGIFIVLDHFSKFPFLNPVKSMSTLPIITFLEHQIFHIFGILEKIVSDNGVQFKSQMFNSLVSKYGIKHVLTAFHSPQANNSERVNRTVIKAIRAYILDNVQRNWDQHLSEIAVSLRNSFHCSTKFSPYFACFGQNMMIHADNYKLLKSLNDLEEGTEILSSSERLRIIRSEIQRNLDKAYENSKKGYNLRVRHVSFEPNEIVFRRNFVQSDKAGYINAKLCPKFIKAQVMKKIGNVYYQLKDVSDSDGKKTGIYHAKDMLKLDQT